MIARLILVSLLACLSSSPLSAQPAEIDATTPSGAAYTASRNAHGQPDLHGVWTTITYTLLERPPGLPLVLEPAQAAGFAQAVLAGSPDNTDPDVEMFGPPRLFRVNGEFRSSVIVHPEDGRMPFNERGRAAASHSYFKAETGFDHPEQRPGVERCLESWGAPPMRAFMYQLFHAIVQFPDKVVIVSEDMGQVRVIHLNGKTRPDVIRSLTGHSVGRWEDESLVVTTTHFRGDIPERATIERPMLISAEATVTERFTRVAEDELLYQYTVNDPVYYTEPWRGEFSLTLDEGGHIYEYSCHEGNYSMVGGLRGARVMELREEMGITD